MTYDMVVSIFYIQRLNKFVIDLLLEPFNILQIAYAVHIL